MRFLLLAVLASLVFATTANAGDIIVGFSANDHSAAHRAAGGKVKDKIGGINADVVSVPDGQEQAFIDRYKRQAGVRYAEVDVAVHALADPAPTPGDPGYVNQWHLNSANDIDVDQPEAWFELDAASTWVARTFSATKVAVLDTGIDQDHPDLPRPIAQENFVKQGASVDDFYGHGTHVAGIIAAVANTTGVVGVAQNVQLINGKVLGDTGSGSCSGVAKGMLWAQQSGATVISMSLGGSACTAEQDAVTRVSNAGSLVIAAAGNNGSSAKSYPAAYKPAVAVAATDSSGALASFSNYGSWVEIAAPGKNIYSTMPNHTSQLKISDYGYLSGTSMATPVVSGVAALGSGGIGIRSALITAVDNPGFSSKFGKGNSVGRVNACRFVTAAAC